jgi:hypothetical protein
MGSPADKQNRYFGRQGQNSPALPFGENHFVVDEPHDADDVVEANRWLTL